MFFGSSALGAGDLAILSSLRGSLSFLLFTHGLRRGLYSYAASRLDRCGGCPPHESECRSRCGPILPGRPDGGVRSVPTSIWVRQPLLTHTSGRPD